MDSDRRQNIITRLGNALVAPAPVSEASSGELPDDVDEDYRQLLSLSNGGYTSDHFMHFFGRSDDPRHDVVKWNESSLWKETFGLGDEFFVFAEDIWGCQYGFLRRKHDRVIRLMGMSTGELDRAPSPFADFARFWVLQRGYAELLAPAQSYLQAYGLKYSAYQHISFKIPPCLGGSRVDAENFELSGSIANLRFCGQVITQAKRLPPGTTIKGIEADPETMTVRLITEV